MDRSAEPKIMYVRDEVNGHLFATLLNDRTPLGVEWIDSRDQWHRIPGFGAPVHGGLLHDPWLVDAPTPTAPIPDELVNEALNTYDADRQLWLDGARVGDDEDLWTVLRKMERPDMPETRAWDTWNCDDLEHILRREVIPRLPTHMQAFFGPDQQDQEDYVIYDALADAAGAGVTVCTEILNSALRLLDQGLVGADMADGMRRWIWQLQGRRSSPVR